MLSKIMFALLFGFWLMGEDIPDDVNIYCSKHKDELKDKDLWMMAAMLLGAPNQKDEILREMLRAII